MEKDQIVKSYKTGSMIELPYYVEPKSYDYYFVGWATSKNGKTVMNSLKSNISGNLTLYAKFEKAEFEG